MLLFTGGYQALFASVFFPSIPLVVNPDQLGTALGVINAFQSLNMGVSPLVFGILKDHTHYYKQGYFYPFLFIII